MSYGSNIPDQFRRVADIVDNIIRGTKPSDIPVEQRGADEGAPDGVIHALADLPDLLASW